MRIEIYIVESEIKGNKAAYRDLEIEREKLIALYSGLTEIDFKGYWNNENKVYVDSGKIWIIYTKERHRRDLKEIARRLREITKQQYLALAVNNNLILVGES